jgi:hypothetical protein
LRVRASYTRLISNRPGNCDGRSFPIQTAAFLINADDIFRAISKIESFWEG